MQSPLRLVVVLAFLALPLLEIALLIKLGQILGFWPVVLTIVLTAIAGAKIIQTQGLSTFRRMSDALAQDREPHTALAHGALLLLAGVLLVLPGPMSDLAGLVLLLPPVRDVLAKALFARAVIVRGRFEESVYRGGTATTDAHARPHGDTIIEGEFERLDERSVDPAPRPPGKSPPRT